MESKNNIDKLFKDKLGNREFDIKESFLADLEEKLDAQKPKNKLWRIFYIVGIVIILGSLSYFYRTIEDTSSRYYFPISLNDSYQKTDAITDGQVDEEVVAIDKIATEATSKTNGSNSVGQLDLNNSQSSQKNKENEQRALEVNISDDKNKSDKEENNKHLASINKNVTTNLTVNNPANLIKDQINSNNAKASNREMVTEKNEAISLTKENLTETENETLLPVGLDTADTNSTSVVLDDNDKEVVASNKESIEDSISIKENTRTELTASKNSGLIDKEITQIVSDTAVPDILTNENQNTTGDLDTNTTEKEIIDDNDAVTNEEIIDATILAVDSIVIDSLALEKEISEEFSDTLSKDDSLANKEVLTPEDANETFKKWTFSVFGGPSLINKKIAGGSTDAYLVKRNDEEANIVSMSYGLRMNYNFNEKINFSLGANSLTYGEDVNYSTIYSTSESIGSVSKDSSYLQYTYTAVPDTINGGYDTTVTIAMIDTTFMVDTTIINVNATDYAGKNRFTYLQIPIMIGYKFSFDKLSVNLRLGGSYGVLLKNSGSYVDNNVSNIELPNLRKTMINLVASATIGYQLKKMNVFIEPKFRLNSGSIITHPEIKQRYTSVGCNFGLSFDF